MKWPKDTSPPKFSSKILRSFMSIVLAIGICVPASAFAEAEPAPEESGTSTAESSLAPEEIDATAPDSALEESGAEAAACEPGDEKAQSEESDAQASAEETPDAAIEQVSGEEAPGSESLESAATFKTMADAAQGVEEEGSDEETSICPVCNVEHQEFGECGDDLHWCYKNGTLTISGTGAMWDYKTANKTGWFPYYQSIKSINMNAGITYIGASAFEGLQNSNFTHISVPEGVTSIGGYAFCRCSNLTSVQLPESLKSIGHGVFQSTKALKQLNIPENVEYIGRVCFFYCGIESATISCPSAVLGESAFFRASNLKSITLPSGMTEVKPWTFACCSSLKEIIIPESVTSIGEDAFSTCYSLTNIDIPDKVESIGNSAFYSCINITSIQIPESVTSIGNAAFSKTGLTAITIEGTPSIGQNCFASVNATSLIYPAEIEEALLASGQNLENATDKTAFVAKVNDVYYEEPNRR